MSMEQRVRPEVLNMARPRHGGDVWSYGKVRDYSSNVNPLGAPERLTEYIAEAAQDLTDYPDDSCAELKGAIALRYSVPVDNIMVGAGSAELIRLFPEVFVRAGDKVIMPRPTFSEYGFGCRLMGADIIDLALPEENGFQMDVGSMVNAIVPGTKVVYVCNPNNPTARMISRKEVMELVTEASRRNAMVFLDETLLELSERDQDLTCMAEVEGHDNIFLIRSFTKSFAMPGLRIGYGFGSKEMVRYMEVARLSWNLGTIEQRVATRLMSEEQEHSSKGGAHTRGRKATDACGGLAHPAIPHPCSGLVLLLQPRPSAGGDVHGVPLPDAPEQRAGPGLFLFRWAMRPLLSVLREDQREGR